AFLTIVFPSQSIVEAVYFPKASEPALQKPGRPPIVCRMAGPSRLVFRLPDIIESIPYTLDGLLDWSRLELTLAPVAAVTERTPSNQRPAIAQPNALQTALELPYRLFLSPRPDAPWRHSIAPITHAGRTEIWHTRLARYTGSLQLGAPKVFGIDEI